MRSVEAGNVRSQRQRHVLRFSFHIRSKPPSCCSIVGRGRELCAPVGRLLAKIGGRDFNFARFNEVKVELIGRNMPNLFPIGTGVQ